MIYSIWLFLQVNAADRYEAEPDEEMGKEAEDNLEWQPAVKGDDIAGSVLETVAL